MAHNGKIKAWVVREKWKCERMPHEAVTTKKGKRFNKYNFNSGLTKTIYDAVIKDLNDSGIPAGQLPTIMARCGLTIASITKKLEGTEETHLYEIADLLEPLNYKVYTNGTKNEILRIEKMKDNYTYTHERELIIIQRNVYPKFFINFNPNKPTDFEINFDEETLQFRISERKMIQLVMSGIDTFYETSQRVIQKKMYQNIRSEIRRQYLNGEIITKQENKKRLK